MKKSEWAPGVLEQFKESYDFATCQRGDGSYYGTGGTCRKGSEVSGVPEKEKKGGTKVPGAPSTGDSKGHEAANEKFMKNLGSNLPEGTKVSIKSGEVLMETKTKGGTKLGITFSSEEGYNFKVNGSLDAGGIKDRREQVSVALAVKKNWEAVTKSLPTGSVVKTRAWAGDGLEQYQARVKAYERMGFGKPKSLGGEMYAKKMKDGSMKKATAMPFNQNKKKADAVFFSEADDNPWLQAIFGNKVAKK